MVTRETFRAAVRALDADSRSQDKLLGFHDLLEHEAIARGFIGPRERERLVERHILQSAALVPLLRPGGGAVDDSAVVDVGSGAGLPGVVLACLGVSGVVLVEADGRRARFLRDALVRLELDAEVVTARAEDLARDHRYRDQARAGVARALAVPPVALELLLPFVKLGGSAVLIVGQTADIGQATVASRELGGSVAEIRILEVPGSAESCRAMIVAKEALTPPRYPRRAGMPGRRPLGSEH